MQHPSANYEKLLGDPDESLACRTFPPLQNLFRFEPQSFVSPYRGLLQGVHGCQLSTEWW